MLITLAETLGGTTLDDTLTLSTGTGSRAASSLGRFFADDYQLLDPFAAVEGSAALWSDLEPGLYQLTGQLATRDDENNDIAGFWDKRSLRTVSFSQLPLEQRPGSTVWRETQPTTFYINVPYDTLGLTILDADNSRGTSEAIVNSIERVGDLQFAPVTPIDVAIAPSWSLGDVDYAQLATRPDELRVGTATGNRAISSISRELTGDYAALADYGTEGSIAQWSVPNGEYAIEWQFYTAEDDLDRDAAYFWNGDQLELLTERAIATEQISPTRWQSDWQTSTVQVVDGKLTFVTLDTGDGADFSQLRIRLIEQLSELIEMPLLQPPPEQPEQPEQTNEVVFLGAIASEGLHVYDEFLGTKDNWNDPVDNWTFRLTEPMAIDFALENTETQAGIQWRLYELLFDSDYPDFDEIAQGYSTGTGINETFNLGAGNYLIELLPNTNDYEFYDLHLTQNTAPTTHGPILGEPPWPYPEHPEVDMGNDWENAWDLGLQKPWETDSITGTTWTHGYVYPSYHLGATYITENLGGETVGGGWDSVDRLTFFLEEGSYLNAFTDHDAITELVRFEPDGTINAVASIEYGGRLQTWLEPGNYGLSFFVEGDGAEINTALYWSNSDPNYAD